MFHNVRRIQRVRDSLVLYKKIKEPKPIGNLIIFFFEKGALKKVLSYKRI